MQSPGNGRGGDVQEGSGRGSASMQELPYSMPGGEAVLMSVHTSDPENEI